MKSKEEIYNIAKEFIEKKAKIKMPKTEEFDDVILDFYHDYMAEERVLTYSTNEERIIQIQYIQKDFFGFEEYIRIETTKNKKDYKEILIKNITL